MEIFRSTYKIVIMFIYNYIYIWEFTDNVNSYTMIDNEWYRFAT